VPDVFLTSCSNIVARALAWASYLVITHETRRAWRPLRRVFGLCRASVCDSGLKGRFPVAQGAALGLGLPPKFVFRPEGPISKRVWLRGHARRSRCLRTWLR